MTTITARIASRLPFYYGWTIVATSFMTMFVSNGMAFWGLQVFVGPMQDDTGWTRASLMGALTVRWLVGGVGGLFMGQLLDRRHGPLFMFLIATLIDGGSMAALYWADNAFQFLLLFGVVGGVGSVGTGRLISAALVPKWFVARRGLAMGIAATGSGLSALVISPIANVIVQTVGWREGWVWMGALTVVLLLPFGLFLRRAPEDIGLLPDGAAAQPSKRSGRQQASMAEERSYTVHEAMRSWTLWLLVIAMSVGLFSMSTNASSMVPYFRSIGFTPAVAAAGLAVYGGFSTGSRFLWGYAADRMTVRRAIVVQAVLTSAGVALYLAVQGHAMLFVVAGYQGLMLGGFVVLQPLIWAEYFGRRNLGAITGITQFFTTFVLAAGPLFAGWVFDTTDAYTWAYRTLVASWLLCAALTVMVRPVHDRPI